VSVVSTNDDIRWEMPESRLFQLLGLSFDSFDSFFFNSAISTLRFSRSACFVNICYGVLSMLPRDVMLKGRSRSADDLLWRDMKVY